jgi:hypothetical protein
MAFTYTSLKTNIADFLNRDDLTAKLATFIELGEARINRDLRHWQMEARSEATFDDRYEDVPSDWLEVVRITIGEQYPVTLVSQAVMQQKRGHDNTAGRPQHYTLSNGQIEFWPTPDASYEGSMIYFAQIAELSDSNTSNWLLSQNPDIYLYSALIHTAPYLAEDQRLIWAGLYGEAMDKLNEKSDSGRWSGSGLVMR